MGQEYNEDYVRIRHRNDFSNKLFSAWDYHITNKYVAHFKHKAMKKHFEVHKLQINETFCTQVALVKFNFLYVCIRRMRYGAVKKGTQRGMLKNGSLFLPYVSLSIHLYFCV